MKPNFRNAIQTILRKTTGYHVMRYISTEEAMKMKILVHYNINRLFDIGANTGKYAFNMRKNNGYKGKIISFEPLKEPFKTLKEKSLKDENWIVNNYALGNENNRSIINISANSQSSSILNMLQKHIDCAPDSRYIAREEIEIKKFDSIFSSFFKLPADEKERIMLKIDTQGYERFVIEGAKKSLKHIIIIQLEMSIVPLYQNEMLFIEMCNYMNNIGFILVSLERNFSDPITGELLQVDGIFVNKAFYKSH